MAATIRDRAVSLANLANKDETLINLFNEGIEIAEKSKQTVHKTFARMSADKLLSLEIPKPGTDTGNNPDKYESVNPATGRNETGSFVNDFADNTDAGKAITLAKTRIADAKDISDPDKKERVKKYSQQTTTLRSLVRRVFLAFHQIEDIKANFPTVGVSLKMVTKSDGAGGTKRVLDDTTTAPWCITDKSPRPEGEPNPYAYISTGEFLALNCERAKLNLAGAGNNEWSALLKSGRKGKKSKKGGATAGTTVARIVTIEQAADYAGELGLWLSSSADGDTGKSSGAGKIMHKLANMPKGDDRKRFVTTLGNIIYGLDGIHAVIDAEYKQYLAEQNAANAAVTGKAA